MANKVKDYYNIPYAKNLAEKIKSASKVFDYEKFILLISDKLESLEFLDRQFLLANALKESLPLDYSDSIDVFYKVLGPELKGPLGMFTEGYWLWPFGKFVELFGTEHFEKSCDFSKELTKRFTSEFCMRAVLEKNPERGMKKLLTWSKDENIRVRRLASECMRIRLPWAKKLYVALEHFDIFVEILSNLKDDKDKTTQKSVANNLNDLYKEDKVRFEYIVNLWSKGEISKECAWIIKHGSRTKDK